MRKFPCLSSFLNKLYVTLLIDASGNSFSWPQSTGNINIARFKDDKACAISYTFDDGLKEHYTLVTP